MRSTICLLLAIAFSLSVTAQSPQLNLIPWPVEVKQSPGIFLLKDQVAVSSDLPAGDWAPLFNYFRDEMKKLFRIIVVPAAMGKPADISFLMRRLPTSGKPAYKLSINKNGIVITSNFAEPAFQAMQTFFS